MPTWEGPRGEVREVDTHMHVLTCCVTWTHSSTSLIPGFEVKTHARPTSPLLPDWAKREDENIERNLVHQTGLGLQGATQYHPSPKNEQVAAPENEGLPRPAPAAPSCHTDCSFPNDICLEEI